jgi:hypothetical protein
MALRSPAGVRARAAGVDRRGPDRVPAQAAVARRSHPSDAAAGGLSPPSVRDHPAPAGIWCATRACSGQPTGSAPSSARWCPRSPPSRRRAAPTGAAGSRGPRCCAGCSPPPCLRARAAAGAAWSPSSSTPPSRALLAALGLPCTPAIFAPARAPPQAEALVRRRFVAARRRHARPGTGLRRGSTQRRPAQARPRTWHPVEGTPAAPVPPRATSSNSGAPKPRLFVLATERVSTHIPIVTFTVPPKGTTLCCGLARRARR